MVNQFTVPLRQQAVLTTILRPLANKAARGGIQGLGSVGFQLALRLELQNRNDIGSVDDSFVVCSFVLVQKTFVSSLGKYTDFLFNGWSNAEFSHATRGFSVETTTQRVQEIVQHF